MSQLIQPDTYVVIRLPSDTLKILQIVPNTTISIGKYGSFPANSLLGRPYNLTFEIVEPSEDRNHTSLRVLPAAEVHAEGVENDISTPDASGDGRIVYNDDGLEYEVMEDTGEVVMRTNRETTDDPSRQKLSMKEIEALKKEGTGAGKDLISRLLLSHSGIGQKTTFSLAKYTLRKSRKFMRRFTVLPLDVSILARWLLLKEPMKIMEIREETLALISSLANIRWSSGHDQYVKDGQLIERGCGRWLVTDETGGLIVATLAERMGILSLSEEEDKEVEDETSHNIGLVTHGPTSIDGTVQEADVNSKSHPRSTKHHRHRIPAMSATSNTITLLHANNQPNLSLLKYFLFDTNDPSHRHPLYTHLKTLSWLQLISPEDDPGYIEPEFVPDETLSTWKSGKRATYYRKRRRWERVKGVVEDTRAGEFDGLIVASVMDPINILQHTIGLLRGAAPVIVYSPHLETLTELADVYSTARRAAFVSDPPDPATLPNEDFPVDPSLLLAPTIQTATAHHWQCLPGRTHPLMSSRGGAEGYLFTATRVLPAEGRVKARGKFKRRKMREETGNGGVPEENATEMDIDSQSET